MKRYIVEPIKISKKYSKYSTVEIEASSPLSALKKYLAANNITGKPVKLTGSYIQNLMDLGNGNMDIVHNFADFEVDLVSDRSPITSYSLWHVE
jgi:hypothetical protein